MPEVLYVDLDDDHFTPAGHPERPARLDAVRDGAHEVGGITHIAGRPATLAEITAIHDPDHVAFLAEVDAAGGGRLDPDTWMSPGTFTTAIAAAGAGLAAIDALRAGAGTAAFVGVRPPGHHAGARHAMGFCVLNNVAIAAAALRAGGERVVILDWDAHHGNGTQDLFWEDPHVLYASLHQWPAYPGTGRADQVGPTAARGTTVNVPMPAGATGDVALRAIDAVIGPVVEDFEPTWVLVSCGFDAHADDPITDLGWSAGDFAELTARVMRWAPRPGRLVAFLEGGYDLRALRRCTVATLSTLAGDTRTEEPPTSGGPGMGAVDDAMRWWRSV
jgi:acetoin utilization deacetylase AcuC-like enzyme